MSKTILITGSSTGIGAGIARDLAKDNNIVVHYNSRKDAAEKVLSEVENLGGSGIVVQADITTPEGCEKLMDAVKSEYGKLDYLINNAGGLVKRVPIAEFDWDFINSLFHLNSTSVMYLTSLALPLLNESEDANIINISSIVARNGVPGSTTYGASKGAIDTFTRGAAKELAPKIRVNAIAPGVIETPFQEKVSTPEMLENWRNVCPLKKNGEPKHIAQAVKMVLENDFMTGETIDVNGGMNMR